MEQIETGFQSKGQILDYFQAVTRYNFEDSILFLNRYDWNLNKALQEIYPEDVRGEGLTNAGHQPLTSLAIRDENDQHFAEYIQSTINRSIVEKKLIIFFTSLGCIQCDCDGSTHKRIAVVAHNNKKAELIECLKQHRDVLAQHKLYGTGTTGSLVEEELKIPVTKYESGPFGGDQQLGARITSRKLDVLIFFIDPLDCHPHSVDVQALLRLAQVYGIVCATTAATVDFILSSKLMNEPHIRKVQLSQPTKPK